MKRERKPVGRPPGKDYPVKKQLRLSESDAAKLRSLVGRRGGSESEVVRNLIREAAE